MNAASSEPRSDCPISYALELFGDRWTLLVLRDLMFKSRYRYRDLLKCDEGIATNVLADRLKRLERHGFVEKQRDPEDRRQFIYLPKHAAVGLVPMLVEMTAWGMRNGTMTEVDEAFLQRFDADREGLVDELKAKVHDTGDDA